MSAAYAQGVEVGASAGGEGRAVATLAAGSGGRSPADGVAEARGDGLSRRRVPAAGGATARGDGPSGDLAAGGRSAARATDALWAKGERTETCPAGSEDRVRVGGGERASGRAPPSAGTDLGPFERQRCIGVWAPRAPA